MVKAITEVVKESKTLVKEIDELIDTARKTKMARFAKLDEMFSKKEYYGEMVDYGDSVEIIQEVGIGIRPEVKYRGGKIVIRFGKEHREFEVGYIDKDSMEAYVTNGVLTIKARRCKDAGEDNEHISEGEGDRGEN